MNTLRIPTIGTMMLRNNNGVVCTLVVMPEPHYSLLHSTSWGEDGFEPIILESIELPGNGRAGCLTYRYCGRNLTGRCYKEFHDIEVLVGIEWPEGA